jgi:hypothetical protein
MALVACVLADPPPLQDPPPATRPTIIATCASPELGAPIGKQPTDTVGLDFAVCVAIDPNQPLQVRVFVDYGTPTSYLIPQPAPATDAGVGGDDGGTVLVAFHVFASSLGDPTQCHTIELDVATNGWVDLNGVSNVPVVPPGGDRAVWSYEPTGTCAFYDAGSPPPPAADADADADAGDASSE